MGVVGASLRRLQTLEKVAAGDSLEEKLRKLIQDYNSCKQELANFKYDLQETMKKLQISSQTGQSLESRLDEIIREYAFCQERVYVAVNPVHMRSKRQQERQGAVNKEQRRLQPLLQTLIDRYHAVRFTMERSERAARVSSERLIELQIQLDEVEMSSTKRMEKAVITAKSERQALVKAALGSLQQLRMYLTQTLGSGWTIESPEDDKEDDETQAFVWNRFKSRWGVLPNAVAAAADELEQQLLLQGHVLDVVTSDPPRNAATPPPPPSSPYSQSSPSRARVRAVHGGSPRLRTALPATPDQEDVAFFNHQGGTQAPPGTPQPQGASAQRVLFTDQLRPGLLNPLPDDAQFRHAAAAMQKPGAWTSPINAEPPTRLHGSALSNAAKQGLLRVKAEPYATLKQQQQQLALRATTAPAPMIARSAPQSPRVGL